MNVRLSDIILGSVLLAALSCTLGVLGRPASLGLWDEFHPPSPDLVEFISAEQAFDLRDEVTFIDARESVAFDSAHIEGAISIPADGLDETRQFPPGDCIVYCDGAECGASKKVAKWLTEASGRKVFVLEQGFPDWRSHGYPISERAGVH